MSPVEKLLCELIAVPSVNPSLAGDGHPGAGEEMVGEFVAAYAATAGLDIHFQEVEPGRSIVFARLASAGKAKRRILLAPHLDTVDGDPKAFTPRRAAGRIYGRGATDTKGSVAAMLFALCEQARKRGAASETEILFAGLVDEEFAQLGSRMLAKTKFRADLAIVGEPTRLRVVTAHKGNLWLRFRVKGKSAHGATPELGVNAIHQMSRIVEVLETKYAAILRKRSHALLGQGTVNVGVINGGRQPNIVPDNCEIIVDRRTLPGETEAGIIRELRACLETKSLSAEVDSIKVGPCPALETNPALPLVSQFMRVARQSEPEGAVYFCDAAVLASAGIPSIVFGPGDIAQAHTTDEWISVASLESATRLLQTYLAQLT
jgi:acetylornithine deacetylase/succinyl-diaminopimelate desuccinylase-like protein